MLAMNDLKIPMTYEEFDIKKEAKKWQSWRFDFHG
jgi:hypothetical protein